MMETSAPYRDGIDHLQAELEWLDAGLQALLDSSGGDPLNDPLAAMRGLVVTEEELREDDREPFEASPEWRAFAEFRRRKEREIARDVRASLQAGAELPLARLAFELRLSVWECRCLVLVLASEWDRKYEKWFGYLNDDATCRTATPDLALRLLCDNESERQIGRECLASGALRKLLLESEADDAPLAGIRLKAPLRLEPRTASYLLGTERMDARLEGMATAYDEPPAEVAGLIPEDTDPAWRLLAPLAERPEQVAAVRPFVHLWGPDGDGQLLRLRKLAALRGQRLLAVEAGALPREPDRLRTALARIVREAALTGAALAFAEGADAEAEAWAARRSEFAAAIRRYAELVRRPLVGWTGPVRRGRPELPAPEGAVLREAEVGVPSAAVRAAVWEAEARRAAGGADMPEAANLPDLARELGDKYRFTPGQIRQAWRQAAALASARGESAPRREDLEAASRRQFRHRLSQLADRIVPVRAWSDLVLPEEPLALLREACHRFSHRETVLSRWGFGRKLPYGTGVHLLLAGPPGTGKTMAAEIIAGELGLELYRIDLSRIVSKYIGETEQRLRELFDEAEQSGAILFFDEGDALFGKRTEVKDAHDRYANMEAAYLLQRIEAYDGVTVLATNLMQNLDEALLRRMSVVVKFPFPDAADRERIFRAHLPPEAPLAEDVDLSFLAARLDVSGGHIKNIVLAAAFLAAAEGMPIGMPHLVRAARQELRKMGKILIKEAFAPYSDNFYETIG
ncbi:ATP-binding protein [Cohnella zeiphila]|uniref:ATP-binding protein n=1 Tax=Cohnella zeiphila TaxID=2761120 RepID=A0A7X0ST35_9BACL|nr:ATP-binding protein [Cohnella zeiphila]MBB6735612.1 ATP-binding protein [Cohnella zeiphila]